MDTKELEIELESQYMDHQRQGWNRACLQAGIPALSEDTCARILAVLSLHDNEQFAFSGKFAADMEYIQNRFHIHGAGIPDAKFVKRLMLYINELEEYARTHVNPEGERGLFPAKPQWAVDMFEKMYGIKI